MELSRSALSPLRLRRPVLRAQLTLLYSGLLIVLLAVVLFATGTVLRSSQSQTAAGVPGSIGRTLGNSASQTGSGDRHFAIGPALIALAALAVAIVLAWWLAGRFLRPLREMTAAAREISATNLSRRLAVKGPDDELTELGRTLDDLSARLEASFASQRNFVANASHELRTPLAGQRVLLQVAVADPEADVDSLRASCEEALRLGEQEERLIEALFTLASGERGIERPEPFDLGEITGAMVAGRRQEAGRNGVELRAALDPAPARGEPRLVESLVANLLDNAIRHNSVGGRVEVSTSVREGRATVAVSNTGPAIPPEEVERLFLPFRRPGDERIGRDGHGLGLAIVRAIATAHDARLTAVARADGGLEIEVGFPPGGTPT
jgi:signal transduction histidine kinase